MLTIREERCASRTLAGTALRLLLWLIGSRVSRKEHNNWQRFKEMVESGDYDMVAPAASPELRRTA